MKAKGCSLWLIPAGEKYQRFAALIKKLAKKYAGPIFKPHITLLGETDLPKEEVLRRCEQLVAGQKPFTITLKDIGYQNYHFRALFLKVQKNQQLLALHKRAKEIFDMRNIPPYMPHLSLLYGNYSPEVKKKIIKEIGKGQTTNFIIDRVFVYKTGGEAEIWYKIGEVPFK